MELSLEPEESDLIGESQDELRDATNTTGFAPVVRIENSSGERCTATAITDDILATAIHCIKSGNNVRDWVQIKVAHGANSSADGNYSSYFMFSADIYDNVSGTDSDRDIAFIKFGAGTFSEWYPLARISSSINGQSVTLVGFGGNSTKSYGAETVTHTIWTDNNNYAYARTDNLNNVANTESGDSGGPMLRSTGSSYEVLGVLFGTQTFSSGAQYSKHVLASGGVYDHVMSAINESMPKYCVENWKNANYGGWSMSFCNSAAITNDFNSEGFADPFKIESHWKYGNWNDEISSMSIPDNTILTVYKQNGQSGDALTFQSVFPFGDEQNIPELDEYGFHNKISSFRMVRTTSTNNEEWQIEITRHGKCLDLTGGSTSNGTNIQQWSCVNGETNQFFRIEAVGSYYQIKHDASGKCLDVSGWGTGSGDNIHLWSCHGGDNQLWSISSLSGTSDVRDFQIRNKHSGKCMDLASGNSSNGTNIYQWTCNSSNVNQAFALRMVW